MAALTCPAGHRFQIPRIVYGYPSDETFAAAERGEITIGGCLPDVPVERACPTCGLMTLSGPAWWSGEVSGDRPESARSSSGEPI